MSRLLQGVKLPSGCRHNPVEIIPATRSLSTARCSAAELSLFGGQHGQGAAHTVVTSAKSLSGKDKFLLSTEKGRPYYYY
jgi:hypothetical protein